MSFAQFEREVTGERIRDKIKASKAKGMWMGGAVPLGYDAKDRTLVPNPQEAELVRHIFERYVVLGSVRLLERELEDAGTRSKIWQTGKGRTVGGKPFSRGQLYALLKNPLYIGRIRHKADEHPGLHPAIVSQELFGAVQTKLAEQRRERVGKVTAVRPSILKGILFDAAGSPMSPATGRGHAGRRYRYYVSSTLIRGARQSGDLLQRIAADPLEALLTDRLQLAGVGANISNAVERVILRRDAVDVYLKADRNLDVRSLKLGLAQDDCVEVDRCGSGFLMKLAIGAIQRGGRTWLISPQGHAAVAAPRRDRALIKALHTAHAHLRTQHASPLKPLASLTEARAPSDRYISHIARFAFLAPDIQRAIIEGRQPPGFTLQRLMSVAIPLTWSDQRQVLGFPGN